MKSEKILLIVNPVSGRMKSKDGLFEILDELYRDDPEESAMAAPASKAVAKPAGPAAAPVPTLPFGNLTAATLGGDPNPDRRVTVAPTMHRGHASMMAATAAEEGYDTVICCGGDGTFNETITGLLEKNIRVPVGYIPSGSTNDFASSMKLSTNPLKAAQDIIEGSAFSYDVGKFGNRYFSYVASFGAFTQTSYTTPQGIKNILGHTAYVLSGISELSQIRKEHVRMEIDGEIVEDDFVFGAISNSTSVGGVLTLDPSDA